MDDSTSRTIYDVESSDPDSRLIDRSAMSDQDVRQIGRLMGALGRLRSAEDRLTEASLRYMKLNRTDMRALHYLITVTEETREAALSTVGVQQAKRFHAAARLTPDEREAVIRFLDDMAREITEGTETWADAGS